MEVSWWLSELNYIGLVWVELNIGQVKGIWKGTSCHGEKCGKVLSELNGIGLDWTYYAKSKVNMKRYILPLNGSKLI